MLDAVCGTAGVFAFLPALMSLYVQILTEGGRNFTGEALVALLAHKRFADIEVQLNREYGCRDTVLARKC